MEKIWIYLITLIPGIELRGSLPYILLLTHKTQLSLFIDILIIFILNIAIGIVIYLFIKDLLKFMAKTKIKRFLKWYLKRSEKKAEKINTKTVIGRISGLAFFIGIPLPGTGVYTGAIIADILNYDLKTFLIAETLGVLMAIILIVIGFSFF